MSKMVEIRNVPDALHRTLKARAAVAGMSLSDDLLAEIRDVAERPTPTKLRARIHQRKPTAVPIDTARLVREELTFVSCNSFEVQCNEESSPCL